MELKINKTFKLTRKLGSGAFGEIFHGINLKTNEEVAIKLEHTNTKHPQLFYEAKLYQYLLHDNSVVDKGIPHVYYCATEGGLQHHGHGSTWSLLGRPVQHLQ